MKHLRRIDEIIQREAGPNLEDQYMAALRAIHALEQAASVATVWLGTPTGRPPKPIPPAVTIPGESD